MNNGRAAASGRMRDSVVLCFDGAMRNCRRLTSEQKQLAAELAIRHSHRGLSFTVKVMKDHGLVADSTYERDCSSVRRAIRFLHPGRKT